MLEFRPLPQIYLGAWAHFPNSGYKSSLLLTFHRNYVKVVIPHCFRLNSLTSSSNIY